MNKTHRRSFSYVLAVMLSFGLLVSSFNFVEAQEAVTEDSASSLLRCPDYFAGGSVQVSMSPYFHEVYTNNPIIFGGNIINDNPYPIVDGQVWMKVYRTDQTTSSQMGLNHYPVVDFILVRDDIVLPANSEKTLEFEWEVPQYLAEGEYMSGFFFTTNNRHNLLGLTYADNVIGNSTSFNVKNISGYVPVTFDKSAVHINNTPVNFAKPAPTFDRTERVVVYNTLVNNADADRMVEVTWTAYRWDALREENKFDTKTESFLVPKQSQREVIYEPPIVETDTTLVVAELKDADAASMLNIRFNRDGLEKSLIKFPTILNYPLKAGEEASVVSCVEPVNALEVSDNVLTLTVKDVKGNIIHSYTYEGNIDISGMALKDSFTPKSNYGSFSLTATLSREGKVLETSTLFYDCQQLDSAACTEDTEATGGPADKDSKFPSIIVFGAVFVVVAIVLLVIARLRSRSSEVGESVADEYNTDNQ